MRSLTRQSLCENLQNILVINEFISSIFSTHCEETSTALFTIISHGFRSRAVIGEIDR